MPKRKTRIFEGTNDGADNPWKVLSSFNVYYGHGSRETFYIQKADRKDLTEDRVLFMIQKHRGDKRPAQREVVAARARERELKRRPMQRRLRKVDSQRIHKLATGSLLTI